MQWLLESRGKDRVWGLLKEGTLMQWKWTGEGIVMLAKDSGIWPIIAGIGKEREQWKKDE